MNKELPFSSAESLDTSDLTVSEVSAEDNTSLPNLTTTESFGEKSGFLRPPSGGTEEETREEEEESSGFLGLSNRASGGCFTYIYSKQGYDHFVGFMIDY